MSLKDWVYLGLQIAYIGVITTFACMVLIRMRGQRYGIIYSFLRKFFYKDTRPCRWRREHPIYLHYWVLFWGLLILDLALVNQIRNSQIYTKPIEFFISGGLISWSMIHLLRYVHNPKE